MSTILVGYEKDGVNYWLTNNDFGMVIDKSKAFEFSDLSAAENCIVLYLSETVPWFVERDGDVLYSVDEVARIVLVRKAKELAASYGEDFRSIVLEPIFPAEIAGDGLYGTEKKTIPMVLVMTVDVNTIERRPDGFIEYAYCFCEGLFSPVHWNTEKLGLLYTDSGVEASVNKHLATLGYKNIVGWSEAGRQENTVADFDMNYVLIDEIWPDLKETV